MRTAIATLLNRCGIADREHAVSATVLGVPAIRTDDIRAVLGGGDRG